MKKLLFFSSVLSSFIIKNIFMSYLIGFITKLLIGINIQAEVIKLSLNKVTIERAHVKDDLGRQLGYIGRAEVGLNLRSSKIVEYVNISKSSLTLEIDLENNFINWAYPFNKEPDYKEENVFSVPELGDVTLTDSTLTFIDKTYSKDIIVDVPYIEGRVKFDNKNSVISISGNGKDGETSYFGKVELTERDPHVKLSIKNLEIKEEFSLYTKAEDIIKFNEGIANVDLEIDNGDIAGEIEFSNTNSDTSILKDVPLFSSGLVKIDQDFIKGKINSTILDRDVETSLSVDIANKTLFLTIKFDDFPFKLIDNISQLNKFNLVADGDIEGKIRIITDIPNNSTEINGRISSKGAHIFKDEFIKADLSILLNKDGLSNLQFKSKLEEGYFDLAIIENKSGYRMSLSSNICSEALQFLSSNLPIPSFRVKASGDLYFDKSFDNFKGSIKSHFLDAYILDDSLDLSFKKNRDNFQIDLSNRGLTSHIFLHNNSLSFSAKIPEVNKIKFQDLEIDLSGDMDLSIGFNDLKLYKLYSNLNFKQIKSDAFSFEPFLFQAEGNQNEISSNTFDLNVNLDDAEVSIPKLGFKGIVNEESLSLYFMGESINVFYSDVVDTSLTSPILSIVISESGIRLRKLATDIFRLEGFIPFDGDPLLDFAMNEWAINSFVKIENVDIDLEKRKININNLDVTVGDLSIPVIGSMSYDDKAVYIDDFSFGKSNLEGQIGEDIDITARLAFDNVLSEILKEVPFKVSLVGDFTIFGKISSPLVKGDIFLSSDFFPKISFSVGYSDYKVSVSELFLFSSDNEKALYLDSRGYLNLKDNSILLNCKGCGLQLQDIFEADGETNFDFHLDGELSKINYRLNLEMNNFKDRFIVFDRLKIDVDGDNDRLELRNSFVESFNEKIEFEGNMTFKNFLYDFKIKGLDLEVAAFLNDQNDYLENIKGDCSIDIESNSKFWNGSINLSNVEYVLNLEKYLPNINSRLSFYNLNSSINLANNELNISLDSHVNEGKILGKLNYSLEDKKVKGDMKTENTIFSLDNYFNFAFNSHWSIVNNEIEGDMQILSGDVVDVFDNFAFGDSSTKPMFSLKKLSLSIENALKIKLGNFLNLDKVDIDVAGNLELENIDDIFVIKGVISSESGSIEFNKYEFSLLNMKVNFNGESIYPGLNLLASSSILGKNINLSLEGNLGSKDIVVVDDEASKEDDEIFYVSLWSDDYDENNNKLELGDILYLLSAGGNNENLLASGGNILSNQISRSLLLNPLAKRVKSFFGLYQFKLSSPFFDLSNLIEGDLASPLADLRLEVSTNVYKNLFFVGLDSIMDQNGSSIQEINFVFFTIDRWRFFFSFESPFDNILFKGLGLSKKTNFGRHDFEIGVSSLESMFVSNKLLENFKNLNLNFEASLRF